MSPCESQGAFMMQETMFRMQADSVEVSGGLYAHCLPYTACSARDGHDAVCVHTADTV